jgi:hypothetical protein
MGPIIVLSTIHITNKGRLMDTMETFYIFRETKLDNQINDKLAVRPNIIFEIRVQKDPHQKPNPKTGETPNTAPLHPSLIGYFQPIYQYSYKIKLRRSSPTDWTIITLTPKRNMNY